MTQPSIKKILVIRHGALGDFVQNLGAFEAIRKTYPLGHITLLTGPGLVALAEKTHYFDAVHIDQRPRWIHVRKLFSVLCWIAKEHFDVVFDLQNSQRTAFYFRVLKAILGRHMPIWSGADVPCQLPYAPPRDGKIHNLDRLRDQLHSAGIAHVPSPSFEWFPDPPHSRFSAQGHLTALIVPHAAPHRAVKCWPPEFYVEIIGRLAHRGIRSVLIGSAEDARQPLPIQGFLEEWVEDWRGKTSLYDLITLGRQGLLALGNDTGPMHIFAIAGCPTWMLMSAESDPIQCAPRGEHATTLQSPSLADLSPDAVWASIEGRLEKATL